MKSQVLFLSGMYNIHDSTCDRKHISSATVNRSVSLVHINQLQLLMTRLVDIFTDEDVGTISGSHSDVLLSRTPHSTSCLATLLQHIRLNKPTSCLLNPFVMIRMLYEQNTTAGSAINIKSKVWLISLCSCDRKWQIRGDRASRSVSNIFA